MGGRNEVIMKKTITPEIAQDTVGALINAGLAPEGAGRIINNPTVAEMLVKLANNGHDAAIGIICGYVKNMLPFEFQIQVILGLNQLLPEENQINPKWFEDVHLYYDKKGDRTKMSYPEG